MASIYWVGTAADGDWNTTTNWSGSVVPVTSDDVTIDRTTDNIVLNLDQSAVTLASLTITNSFEGTIGNAPDASLEYLQIGATVLTIGDGVGNGSQRINIDLAAVVTTCDIKSANSTGTDFPKAPLRIKANNSSNVFQIAGENSTVGFNDEPDLSSQALGAITVINGNNIAFGVGSSYTSLDVYDGNVVSEETSGTVKIANGTLRLEGSGAIATVIQTGGNVESNTTGTITTYTARGGTLDLQKSSFARTITTLTKSQGFTLLLDDGVTITNDNLDTDSAQNTISVT